MYELREQGSDRFGLDQFTRLIQVVQNHRFRINSERVIDRRQQFARMDGVLNGTGGSLVGLSVDVASFDTCAGDKQEQAYSEPGIVQPAFRIGRPQ